MRWFYEGAVLAPMAGLTDSAFRRVCLSMGATCVLTEMVSAAGLVRGSRRSLALLSHSPEEVPLGAQLFGSRPGELATAAAMVSDPSFGFDFIDLNAGCP
ncbi:tRNA-dihydrouridine synthase family protein, partial [Candidatus Fermentibacterales bacterium]|nr:tRNA-dihydrouridine synthase family protein [Candidatus Fermentibacterales bacterium]